jgi:hypothetical protein
VRTRNRGQRGAIAIGAALLMVAGLTASAGTAAPRESTRPDLAVVAEFEDLQGYVGGLPDDALNSGVRTSLISKLRAARASYERGQPCTSANILSAFLDQTQDLRSGDRTGIAEDLYARGDRLRLLLLASAAETVCADPRIGVDPEILVHESDPRHLEATIMFGRPRLSTFQAGGELWTSVEIPEVGLNLDTQGEPGVPILHRLVAVPRGADVTVDSAPIVDRSFHANLLPVQPLPYMNHITPDDFLDELPPDDVFADHPFAKDEGMYASDEPFPEAICSIATFGQARDLQLADLSCAAGRYRAASDELTLFGSIDVSITFVGGSGAFLTETSASPFESAPAVYTESVLNRDILFDHIESDLRQVTCQGEELLILTHADLRSFADALAQWKQAKGIMTSVFEVNDGPGPKPDTAEEVREFIRGRYDVCKIRPSYVLLFGDAEHIPPFYRSHPAAPQKFVASDYPYAVYPQFRGDAAMDFAVGRLPVDPPQAQTVVDKTINYESQPPFKPVFYNTVGLASQFQCCKLDLTDDNIQSPPDGTDQRAFIEIMEDFRNRLMSQGYQGQRIYTETVFGGNANHDPPLPPYTGDPAPKFYDDGASLPSDLLPPFPWDGDAQDIIDAFDDGRFVMVQLDHGGTSGWSHPHFVTSNAKALTNGDLLPVVLGFNCSSGYFDNETDFPGDPTLPSDPTSNSWTSFSEEILRNPNGGAVATIAATRTTNATGNVMIRGALDAAITGILPDFGPSTPHRRLGDMLNHARLHMIDRYGSGANVQGHLLLYNLLGDPTLEMWTENPLELPPFYEEIALFPDFLVIVYRFEGATLTAFQETETGPRPIGRGVVRDGMGTLTYFEEPLAGVPIQVSASAVNGVSEQLSPPA